MNLEKYLFFMENTGLTLNGTPESQDAALSNVGAENTAADTSAESSADTSATQESTVQPSGGDADNAQPQGFFGSGLSLLLIIVVYAGIFYFMSRRQKKKEKEVRDLQEAIKPGDDVYTSGGLFGKAVDIDDEKITVEFGTNKGVKIPIRRQNVFPMRTLEKEDERVKEEKINKKIKGEK